MRTELGTARTKAPSPINSCRAENFLLQTLSFEMETRDQKKKGRGLWELFRVATHGERAGEHLKFMLDDEKAKQLQRQTALYEGRPEVQEPLYERFYTWMRISIYLRMGGERKSINTLFKNV